MKKFFNKKNLYWIIGIIFFLFIVHLPIMTKNIITADVLLNNSFYNGYSWEVSLGRFGLYIMGLLKSYLSIPHIELIISYILISISIIIIFDLFDIKKNINRILIILIMCISPIISSTLLFHYCSVGYLLALFLSILSLYIYYKWDNKYGKIILPIILLVISLSMYQAYLSFIISIFVFYNLKLLFFNKKDYKKIIPYIGIIIFSLLLYFILMKLSQLFLHINMSYYSNASSIGLSTILTIPNKIIDSYILFYKFFFTDTIMKNIFLHNSILYILIGLFLTLYLIINTLKKNISIKSLIIIIIVLLLSPIYLNSIIFVINDSKLQLLMSASYLVIPIFIISILDNDTKLKYIFIIIFCLLLRNYYIQTEATYLSLENTFNKYYTVIGSAINNNINNLDKQFIVIGDISNNDDNSISSIYKYNYGFVSDEGIFWSDHYVRKIGFERFCYEYFGVDVTFGSEDDYNKYLKNDRHELIFEDNNLIIINLYNYNK